MRTSSRRALTAGAVVLMGVLLAFCAPSATETLGDRMVEAGTVLRDLASTSATAQGDGGAATSPEPATEASESAALAPPLTCARWEYSVWVPCGGLVRYPSVCSVPEGWEPFAVERESIVSIRRCAD